MIIEIKDLPDGAKIRHINVDVSFEGETKDIHSDMFIQNESVNTDSVTSPNIDKREDKEIPQEMKDITF